MSSRLGLSLLLCFMIAGGGMAWAQQPPAQPVPSPYPQAQPPSQSQLPWRSDQPTPAPQPGPQAAPQPPRQPAQEPIRRPVQSRPVQPGLNEPAPAAVYVFEKEELLGPMEKLFGPPTEALTRMLDRVFRDYGRPTAYISGREGGGALIIGARYGEGSLHMKDGTTEEVYWQGPTVGVDAGGADNLVFFLVYNLTSPQAIYLRFPGVEGSAYAAGGYSMTYQQNDTLLLVGIRSGQGLRLGMSAGYIHFTPYQTYNPF